LLNRWTLLVASLVLRRADVSEQRRARDGNLAIAPAVAAAAQAFSSSRLMNISPATDRTPTHGYDPTREDAMAAFA
jgi:hypothetical protein